jgi:hypothetical protein
MLNFRETSIWNIKDLDKIINDKNRLSQLTNKISQIKINLKCLQIFKLINKVTSNLYTVYENKSMNGSRKKVYETNSIGIKWHIF